MLINYILAFAFGYLVADIVNGIKKRLRNYKLLEAMQAQPMKGRKYKRNCLSLKLKK